MAEIDTLEQVDSEQVPIIIFHKTAPLSDEAARAGFVGMNAFIPVGFDPVFTKDRRADFPLRGACERAV